MLLRSAFPLADVPRDFGRTDDCALGVCDWRHSERNVDETPVLVLAHRLVVIDALPSPQAFENGRFLIDPIWRYQDTYGFTDHFVGGIAEQPLCTLIPACDDAVQILGHNRIVRRLDDSGETTRIALGIAAPLDLRLKDSARASRTD